MGTDYLKAVGERLTHVRGQQSQAAFAPAVGIHKNTLGTYERGEREIAASALAGYMALGWNANWLLTGQGPERLEALSGAASSPSQPLILDRETLARASRILDLALELARVQVGPTARAMMLGDVYQHLLTHGFDGDQLLEVTQGLKQRLLDIQEGRNAGVGAAIGGPAGPSTESGD